LKRKSKDIHADLIQKCREGNANAQYRLYKIYVQAMFNICARLLANKEDAEDILQDAFVVAFQKIKSFKGDSTFGAWLKRIVINKALDSLKKKKIEMLRLEDETGISFQNEETDFPGLPPETILEHIKNLPQGARLVLNLHLFEGFKHKEIARMLGISESTSKSQYRRAIALLKDEFLNPVYEKI
jgi:RNA polymerase sigma-70 factor, ECF subfamily